MEGREKKMRSETRKSRLVSICYLIYAYVLVLSHKSYDVMILSSYANIVFKQAAKQQFPVNTRERKYCCETYLPFQHVFLEVSRVMSMSSKRRAVKVVSIAFARFIILASE